MAPDLGITEKIVVEKLHNDLHVAMEELKQMTDFMHTLHNEDLDLLVVDPLVKPILSSIVDFVEGMGRKIGEANMGAMLIALILETREARDRREDGTS